VALLADAYDCEDCLVMLERSELEDIYMDGMADEVSGNVEAPTGHFYRVGAQIVTTDSQGFVSVENFDSEGQAVAEFSIRDDEFSAWDSEVIV
jgi:hypothetical protein